MNDDGIEWGRQHGISTLWGLPCIPITQPLPGLAHVITEDGFDLYVPFNDLFPL